MKLTGDLAVADGPRGDERAGAQAQQAARVRFARQLQVGRYLDPWGSPYITWIHSHTLLRGWKVILNTYTLSTRLNGVVSKLGLGGAYHSALQIGDVEYAYGGHPSDDLGIMELRQPLFRLREGAEKAIRAGEDEDGSAAATLELIPKLKSRVVIGWWMGSTSSISILLEELRDEGWTGGSYRMVERNCNHFVRAFCAKLLDAAPTFKPAPGKHTVDKMVPSELTRLTACLSACLPCCLGRFNAPMPVASSSLSVFQGRSRSAAYERPAWLRRNRVVSAGGDSASTPLAASVAVRLGSGVQQTREGPKGHARSQLGVAPAGAGMGGEPHEAVLSAAGLAAASAAEMRLQSRGASACEGTHAHIRRVNSGARSSGSGGGGSTDIIASATDAPHAQPPTELTHGDVIPAVPGPLPPVLRTRAASGRGRVFPDPCALPPPDPGPDVCLQHSQDFDVHRRRAPGTSSNGGDGEGISAGGAAAGARQASADLTGVRSQRQAVPPFRPSALAHSSSASASTHAARGSERLVPRRSPSPQLRTRPSFPPATQPAAPAPTGAADQDPRPWSVLSGRVIDLSFRTPTPDHASGVAAAHGDLHPRPPRSPSPALTAAATHGGDASRNTTSAPSQEHGGPSSEQPPSPAERYELIAAAEKCASRRRSREGSTHGEGAATKDT